MSWKQTYTLHIHTHSRRLIIGVARRGEKAI